LAAIVLVSILIFPVAAVCIELGGLARDGWPSFFRAGRRDAAPAG
jgi:hypothetical protein